MSEIVPFGKYKGKSAEVLQGDPGYVEWMMAQPGLRERYPRLFQIIINNFGEPTETPEHNRLQARFLDEDFRVQVFQRMTGRDTKSVRAEFEISGWDVGLHHSRSESRNPDCLIELKPTLGDDYPAVLRQMKANDGGPVDRHTPQYRRFDYVVKALLIGECTAAGATFEQIKAIFEASGFQMLELSEFEAVPTIEPAAT